MPLTLFHTAEVHCETFNTLRDRIAPDLELVHHVKSNWLAQARDGISHSLHREITNAVAATDGKSICTCTTIGPVAEAAGAIRIDRPLMQAAAQTAGPVILAYCLDSTREPSLALLRSELEKAGNPAHVHALPLIDLWPLFAAGEAQAFAAAIATAICKALQEIEEPGCVVLAQASMASAAPLLADLPVPVLASPELAFRATLG